MPHELGDQTGPGDHALTYEGDGSADAGDSVAIDQASGQASPTNSGDTDGSEEFAGVAHFDFGSAGDEENVLVHAPTGVIANVASGVSAGERLGPSTTAGQLDSSAGGPVLAVSDEGGTSSTGDSLAAGTAEVTF